MRLSRFLTMRKRDEVNEKSEYIFGILAHNSVFSSINHADLHLLALMMDIKTKKNGELLCGRGDRATEIYILVRGEINIQTGDSFLTKSVGNVVGIYGLFRTGRTRSATVYAKGDIEYLVLDYPRFERFLLSFPEAMFNLFQVVIRDLTEAENE